MVLFPQQFHQQFACHFVDNCLLGRQLQNFGPQPVGRQTLQTSSSCFCVYLTQHVVQAGIFGTGQFYALGQAISSELDVTESTDASDRKAWLIVAYIMAAATAILILLSLLMMRRIKVSLQLNY